MNTSLVGKRALVCGSTQGIGLAAAVELATLGASVTLMARNLERLKEAVKELPWGGEAEQDHHWIAADFAGPSSVQEAVRTEVDPARPYHILVNNTGGPPAGSVMEATPEQFLQAFQSHQPSSLTSCATNSWCRRWRRGCGRRNTGGSSTLSRRA
jgi:3-oxoacyl-[acyl-carrier protein] reductase